jgi:hypothetical protein
VFSTDLNASIQSSWKVANNAAKVLYFMSAYIVFLCSTKMNSNKVIFPLNIKTVINVRKMNSNSEKKLIPNLNIYRYLPRTCQLLGIKCLSPVNGHFCLSDGLLYYFAAYLLHLPLLTDCAGMDCPDFVEAVCFAVDFHVQ